MRAFEIEETKKFMSALLVENVFDNFAVSELKLTNAGYFEIDGHRNASFYTEEELAALPEKEFLLWSEVKPHVFALIKGNKTPISLKLCLRLNRTNTENVVRDCGTSIPLEQVGGIFLNIQFDREGLQVTTGTSLKTFSMDRSLDSAWDEYAGKFIARI